MLFRYLNTKTILLLTIPSAFALSGCESSGNYRISSVGDGKTTVAQGTQGEKGDTGSAGPAGPQGPAGANGASGLSLGDTGALALGGLVGPGGVAGTGLLANTGDKSATNPVLSGVLIKTGGLVNVVADKGLQVASIVDSRLPGGTNLVGTVIGVVKSTGLALVQTGEGQQYLVDGLAAAPGALITATIGKATAIGSATSSPLIGASILSPGQQSGSLLTVGVASNGQLVTLNPGNNSSGLLGLGSGTAGATGLLGGTGGATAPVTNVVTGVTSVVGNVLNLGATPIVPSTPTGSSTQTPSTSGLLGGLLGSVTNPKGGGH